VRIQEKAQQFTIKNVRQDNPAFRGVNPVYDIAELMEKYTQETELNIGK